MAETNSTLSVETVDCALLELRTVLFQAMGIVRLAALAAQRTSPIDGTVSQNDATDVWTALDGAYSLLDRVAGKLEDSETLLAATAEVAHV